MEGKKSEPRVPTDLRKALGATPLVEVVWKSLTPLARWDFIIWINQTKEPGTRKRRIEKAKSMLTAGKRRPCCFTIVPMDLYKALEANPKAKAQWKDLGPIPRRDFVSWIDSAKQPALSKSRAGQACELLAVGKRRP
ncbi:MAG TPA: YdeI/OmpD-associated family protein [Patescibacteria group bacterium]|nr:YdeI/OmpD-associated family protein [Patescibacteria group bacterium]